MRQIEFNINREVEVVLTQVGIDALKQQRAELIEAVPVAKNLPEIDYKPGDTATFQLWVLMNTFGHLVGNGFDVPFETVIRLSVEERGI